MNTDSRKRIFVTLMGANDCDEAYERLLRLGLSRGQEQDIMNVLLLGCLHEKTFNQYYSVLALKFCDYDRKYKVIYFQITSILFYLIVLENKSLDLAHSDFANFKRTLELHGVK